MYATLIVVAALWGAGAGLLLPRAAYRLSVEPDQPYRDSCEAGHPITGPANGWLGRAGCATCAAAGGLVTAPEPGAQAGPAAGAPPGRTESGSAALPTTDESGTPSDEPRPVLRGARYVPSLPAVLVTALVCGLLAAATGPRPELAVWLLLTPVAGLLALVDRNVHRLPDQLTLPLAGAAAVLLGLAALLPAHGGSWPTALLGGLALGGCYFVLFLINPNGMGFGDVKLALSLGVILGWYGWLVLFVGAFAGFLFGSLYGLGLMALRRANRKSAIPFGPFMIAGALLGVLLGALAA
ncbi:prepilin peptidase [Streptomyces sp. NBC_01498]|uniref:prepilin peptidase n=1 Tax=Streptomyces sp. NBC_01498 TaxID=2975870 RepID=UPI002E7BA69A|nr:prepilin peptidase [Streptomyces sp. NBC_01498]WTL24887.1 prepilin peptidase [Streptomyces sp. NBC_01498]